MRSPYSTLLTPIRRRCSHTLLRTTFKTCGFVLVGEIKKIIIITKRQLIRRSNMARVTYKGAVQSSLLTLFETLSQ